MAPALPASRPRSGGGERGAALVETAILIPLVILLTFGLIEFSSAYQSSSTAASTARSAARTASAEAMLGGYATDAAAAAATALQNMPADEPVEMWVYARTTRAIPGADVDLTSFTTCTHQVHQVHLAEGHQEVRHREPERRWLGRRRRRRRAARLDWDSVGVYIKLRHKYITNLFGTTIDLTDHAVFRLEPAPTQLCP